MRVRRRRCTARAASAIPMSTPALPSASHANPSEPCVSLHGHPPRSDRGNGPPAPHQDSGEQRTLPCAAPSPRKIARTSPMRDPYPYRRGLRARSRPSSTRRTNTRPHKSSRAGSGAPAGVRAHGQQQRRERHGSQPNQVESREAEDEQRRREQRHRQIQHGPCRRAASATSSAMYELRTSGPLKTILKPSERP
jgi:hypothetical protein